MTIAIILAGGHGERFGGGMPKQFVEVLGKPVIAYTLDVFEASPDIDAIAIVCQPEYFQPCRDIAERYGARKLTQLVPAGATCPESIRNGVYGLLGLMKPDDIALIHMSVSPLVTQADLSACVKKCREKGCCFTMHPVNICLARRGGEDWSDIDAPKEDYVELITPWAFHYGPLLDLYRGLEVRGHALGEADYTLGLWLAEGHRAWYAPGSDANRLKITTPHDRDVFEALLRMRREQARASAKE